MPRQLAPAGLMTGMTRRVRRVRDLSCEDTRIYLELEIRRVDCRGCGAVKPERLDWLADCPFYTKRFAYFVGRRCRASTIKDVAQERVFNHIFCDETVKTTHCLGRRPCFL